MIGRGSRRAAGRRLGRVLVVAGAMAAASPCVATAATLTNANDATASDAMTASETTVTYAAGPGETNELSVGLDAGWAVFEDSATIAPAPPDVLGASVDGCEVTTSLARCPVGPLRITLGDGDDSVALGPGLAGASIDGGTGTDRIDYGARSDPVLVVLDGTGGTDNLTGVENVGGGSGEDALTGNGQANGLTGRAGGDALIGGPGNDRLDGGPGDDTLDGGAGDDALIGGAGADTFSGGADDDLIAAADGDVDTVTCGNGADTVLADLGAKGVMDQVASDCETVMGPVAAPAPGDASAGAGPVGTPAALLPVPAPGVANPADLTPPKASMRAATRHRLRTVLLRGLPVRVTCGEACGISVALSIERAAARRLGVAGRSGATVLGTARAVRAAAGTNTLRVRLTRKARAALRRSRQVAVTVQVLVSDASRNGTLLQRDLTLVR
jgi:hypothetical protein